MRFHTFKSQALLIDVQEKLVPVMANSDFLLSKTKILLQGLQELEIPLIVSEQYTSGLGETIESLKEIIFDDAVFHEKSPFSCAEEESILNNIIVNQRNQIIIFGVETHICVLQTCLDLIEKGYEICVVVDACSSRSTTDKEVAIQRLKQEGVFITTVESILFELCQTSTNPHFKKISQLIK